MLCEKFVYGVDYVSYEYFVSVVKLGGGVPIWFRRRYTLLRLSMKMNALVVTVFVSSIANYSACSFL